MRIIAKYASTCVVCGQPILAGTGVNWIRGSAPWHVECPPENEQAARRNRIADREYGRPDGADDPDSLDYRG